MTAPALERSPGSLLDSAPPGPSQRQPSDTAGCSSRVHGFPIRWEPGQSSHCPPWRCWPPSKWFPPTCTAVNGSESMHFTCSTGPLTKPEPPARRSAK